VLVLKKVTQELDALRRLKEQERELRLELFKARLNEEDLECLEQEAKEKVNPNIGMSITFPPLPNESFCSRCDCCWGPYTHGEISQKTVRYIVNGNSSLPLGRAYSLTEVLTIGLQTNRIRSHLLLREARLGSIDIRDIVGRLERYASQGSSPSGGCLSAVLLTIAMVVVFVGLVVYLV